MTEDERADRICDIADRLTLSFVEELRREVSEVSDSVMDQAGALALVAMRLPHVGLMYVAIKTDDEAVMRGARELFIVAANNTIEGMKS